MKLQWQISAVQTGQPLNHPEWHFVYIARPGIVLVLLDNDPDGDAGGAILAAATEREFRAILHRRDGITSAQSLARIRAMPRFNRLGFEQGVQSRQTSYQPGHGSGPMLADRLMLSASGMLKLAVIFAHEEIKAATGWQILSRFLDGQDRANAMRFLDNVAAGQHGKPVGSVTRFTLPEIARFDPAAVAMMQRIE